MTELFKVYKSFPSGWGILVINASNAFNPLNWIVMLLNVHRPWPHCTQFVFNTYRDLPVLVMQGHSEFLFSKDSVTQGDPLTMLIYAVVTLPLIATFPP